MTVKVETLRDFIIRYETLLLFTFTENLQLSYNGDADDAEHIMTTRVSVSEIQQEHPRALDTLH